jgi:hydroxypyruvate isomerase
MTKPTGQLIPSVCIDAVLSDLSLEQALEVVSSCGYTAFEFWAWWEKDICQINDLKNKLGLEVSACCTKFIALTDPRLRDDYTDGVRESVNAAEQLDCSILISQVGDCVDGRSRTEQHQSIVDGLKQVAPIVEAKGITLVIEPLNEKVDHPGYFLITSEEAFEIVGQVNSPNIKVVFDIYHQQISEGNLIPNICDNIDKIGHFHAAGQPGRNELTRGEINYPEVFRAIRKTTYAGHVGLEYWPLDDPADGLSKLSHWFSAD